VVKTGIIGRERDVDGFGVVLPGVGSAILRERPENEMHVLLA
jgi:hypothetical protein